MTPREIEIVMVKCNLTVKIGTEYTNDQLENVIDFALTDPISRAVKKISEEDYDYLLNELKAYLSIGAGEITSLAADHTLWWDVNKEDRLNGDNKGYWKRYKHKLMYDKFPYLEIDKFTDRILDLCEDPLKKGAWDRRGLVVGHVQSGKTANYIGLINKAVDSGYKLIVVIAGIHNSLRNQTQERVESDFLGRTTRIEKNKIGVSVTEGLNQKLRELPVPMTLTNFDKDFNKSIGATTLVELRAYTAPTIVVIKKNKSVLEALIIWLSQQIQNENDGFQRVENLPMLLIDDEADNASLNTKKDETNPTTINKLIRILLNMFDQKSFIGYTATPYANIFVPEVDISIMEKTFEIKGKQFELGDDLFPKDFIVNISPGSNYFGASRIFGSASEDATIEEINLIRYIKDQTVDSSFPLKIHKNNKTLLPKKLPLSLKRAIDSHIISAAIRLLRGQDRKHCSMMIHVAHLVIWIDRTAQLVDKYITDCINVIENNDEDYLNQLQKLFEDDFCSTTLQTLEVFTENEEPNISINNWLELKPYLKKAINRFKVFSVHGSKNRVKLYSDEGINEQANGKKYDWHKLEHTNEGPFNYNDKRYNNGLFAIAVGGNRLSRGLTIEGLTTTYYLRVSRLYDTLMQMGRWFGYRQGYVDLCRVYTTRELVNYFRHIVHATDKMRSDFDYLASTSKTPNDYRLKVMTHPSFLGITAAGKMRASKTLKVKFSGDRKQTYKISKKQEYIDNNLKHLKIFISHLGEVSRNHPGLFSFEESSGEFVSSFIKNYKTDQDSFNTDVLSKYIKKVTDSGIMTNWSVALATNTNRGTSQYSLGASNIEESINTIIRNAPVESIDDPKDHFIRKQQILSPRHAYFDLNISNSDFELISGTDKKRSHLILDRRSEQNKALLIIYLLDPRHVEGISNEKPLVGMYIAFPNLANDETEVEYTTTLRGEYEDLFNDDDIENDEEDDLD